MAAKNNFIYLYCIIPKQNQFELEQLGMGEQEVYMLEYKDILAVVSNSTYRAYDISPENLFRHKGIVSEIMQTTDLLPFDYGNVFISKNDLIKFLESIYQYTKKMLRKVSGNVELGLKIFIKNEYFNDEVETSEIKQIKHQLKNLDEKQGLLLKIELGKLVQQLLEQKQNMCNKKIFNYLKQFCVDARINKCNAVKMIHNSAFLVEKDKKSLFDEKVNEIMEQFNERYTYKYTGPWPPYNFIEKP